MRTCTCSGCVCVQCWWHAVADHGVFAVTYLENNRAGITVFGFVVDRTWLHALFMIEFSLVMWLLGKTIGISWFLRRCIYLWWLIQSRIYHSALYCKVPSRLCHSECTKLSSDSSVFVWSPRTSTRAVTCKRDKTLVSDNLLRGSKLSNKERREHKQFKN